MNLAQVCIVTCAVAAFVGCGDDREAVGTQGGSSSARIVQAGSINHAPEAHHDFLTVAEDTSGSIDVTLNDTDADGDPLSVTELGDPDHGTVTFTGNLVTYTPDPGYTGSDELEYMVSDGHGGMGVASVFVTVISVNAPPAAVDDALTAAEDSPGAINLLANDSDPDGDTLTVVAFDQPAHGSVSVASGIATYTPAANYHGPDAFGYTVRDPGGLTSTATVHITVLPVNDAPVAADDAASLAEDSSVAIDVVANDSDVDGDALAITAITQPAHGIAAIVDATHVSYLPAPDYNGADSFTYTVADPSGATATATVALAIAADDAASLAEDSSVTIDVVANDADVDGDALAITAITQPAHGIAAIV
ncbi:MAG TPA: cadherin-like domain-containing protein, partial [Kofleriaceae bacterium]